MSTHGKNIRLWVQSDPGTPTSNDAESTPTGYTAFVGQAHTAKLGQNRDTAEDSAFGSNDKTYLGGLKHGTLTFDNFYDPTLQAILTLAIGSDTPISIIMRPEGDADGKYQYRATYFLTGNEIGGTTGDVVGGGVNFQRTGALTREAIAS